MKRGGEFLGKGAFGCVYDFKNSNKFKPFDTRINTNVSFINLAAKLFADREEYIKEKYDVQKLYGTLSDIAPIYYGYIDDLKVPSEVIDGNTTKCDFINPNTPLYAIVMEKCTKSILKEISDDFNLKLRVFVDKLYNFHKAGYIHCDIKPENIMYNTKNELVLIDYGFLFKKSDITSKTEIGCTPFYMSPLVLLQKNPEKGVVSYRKMVSNHPDFKSVKRALDKLIEDTYGYSFDVYLDNIEDSFVTHTQSTLFGKKTDSQIYDIVDLYSLVITIQYILIKNQFQNPEVDKIIVELLQKIVPIKVQTYMSDMSIMKHQTNIDTSLFGF